MKLYKYTRYDIGKQIIMSSQIALSKPQDFNDPFDCVPVSVDEDLRKAIDILNGYAIDQAIFESLKDVKDKINKPMQKALISFVLWEYRIARKLAKHKPTAYSPIFTFEKFDKFFKLCERLGKVSPEQLQEKESSLMYNLQLNNKNGILYTRWQISAIAFILLAFLPFMTQF